MSRKAFTLVELMIVVAILGILAAIVIPQIQGNTMQAKESAVKDTLRTWRNQIELYKLQHNGLAPGYIIIGTLPVGASDAKLRDQFIGTSTLTGDSVSSQNPVAPYLYGPYLKSIPINPYNNLNTITYVSSGTLFSAVADGTSSGWLYKKETAEIRVNWTGTDRMGVNYTDY